jgi:hypothetical protein
VSTSRFQVPTIRERGQLARDQNEAFLDVQRRRDSAQDVSGRLKCPHCGAPLQFTIQRDGHSRGRCARPRCIDWCH